jgi:hypothetical protein
MLGVGMTYARGDTQAALFPIIVGPFRRGPLRFAATWGYTSVHTQGVHSFGLSDPKFFGRLRLAGSPEGRIVVHVEGAARLPTAKAKLYPFAFGGQDLELLGSIGLPRAHAHAGFGHIWTEPPHGSSLRPSDVPHATHAWVVGWRDWRMWTLVARDDMLWLEGSGRRNVLQLGIAVRPAHGLRATAGAELELGPERDRVLDRAFSLRFATSLR